MSADFRVVVHHNPDCGTSRNVLAIIEAAGYAPVVIDYLRDGWTRPQLMALFAAAGITAREALRDQVAALAVKGAEQILRKEVNASVHAELLNRLKTEL